jgi:hypothetical protein
MIVVRLQGGLGNQMFQYALARSMAMQLNTKFLLDARFLLNRTPRPNFTFRDYDLSIFNLEASFYKEDKKISGFKVYADKILTTIAKYIKKKFPNAISKYFIEQHFHFDTNFLEKGSDVYCIGYFQSYRYFEKIKSVLINDFSFKNPIDTNCLPLLNKIKSTNSVCIHVRRGDYVNNSYYSSTSMNYYAEALKTLISIEKNIELFLFSDDVEWCKLNVNLGLPINFVDESFAGYKAKNHFELMRNCRHFIISNSSFAWWSAYLSLNEDKKVFVTKNWFKDPNIVTKDLFPNDWFIV